MSQEPEQSPRDPLTSPEWQEAVDSAAFFRALEDSKMYGLIQGGPIVNLRRCNELLERGAELGYRPAPLNDLIDRYLAPLLKSSERARSKSQPAAKGRGKRQRKENRKSLS